MHRVALVTGATGAIGEAIARGIAERGLRVVLTARDEAKATAAIARIRAARPDADLAFELVELSSIASIRALASRFDEPLHVLVNNAAECPRQRTETEEGIERQWATNVLGYYRMIRAFEERLAASSPARIVNVASYWAGGLDLSDPEFRSRPYDNDSAYRQSKQADRMLAVGLADELAARGVTINACHPGDVPSKLASDLGFGGSATPDQGAATPIFLATDPRVEGQTGGYYARSRREKEPFAGDSEAVQQLLASCSSYDDPPK